MRKPQPDSPTKRKLLAAAQNLMLAKGFTATTVDDVCESARLTKGSFFHYFETKEALGKAVLDRYVSTMFQAIQDAPFLKKDDPLQRIYGYVDFLIEMSRNPAKQSGCLLGTFSQELSDTHPGIRKTCAQHFARWAEALRLDIASAKAKHAGRKRWDPAALAEHIIIVVEGSLILARANQNYGVVERNLKQLKQYMNGLFGR
ncbi:MAG: TetR/AcrR family transcriptional regulator [Nitrospirota bacterium]|jgi:TetR/AcrR family transcriptional repressor of nem operon